MQRFVVLAVLAACGSRPPPRTCPQAPACPQPVVTAPEPVAQPANADLATLAKLEGEWTGTGEGQPGTSTVQRTFRWILGGRFLEIRNHSTYEPQPKNTKGEKHEDRGLVSFDKRRKKLVYRQFNVEGFVNQFVLESATPDGFVFVTEAIENIPAGFRARETWRITDTTLEETFEIAEPNKDFEVYSRNKLAKKSPTP